MCFFQYITDQLVISVTPVQLWPQLLQNLCRFIVSLGRVDVQTQFCPVSKRFRVPVPCGPLQANALSLWSCTIGRIPIWNINYNFYFINSPWIWGTMAPEAHWALVWIWGPVRWPTPTKLGMPSNFCLIRCPQKWMAKAPEPHWAPLLALLNPGVRVGGVWPHQIAIRYIYYNFDLINSPSVWVTMAPEGHGAQVLPDPDLGSKKVTRPH